MGKGKRGMEKGTEDGGKTKTIIGLVVVVAIVAGIVGLYSMSKDGSKMEMPRDAPKNLPDYAYSSAASLKAYTVALQIPDVLEKIPCYCGCVSMEHLQTSHKHLRDCFVFDDGTFDDHASYCDTCVYEALDVDKWYTEGLPVKDIRARIDAKYGNGRFGPPTKTPPI